MKKLEEKPEDKLDSIRNLVTQMGSMISHITGLILNNGESIDLKLRSLESAEKKNRLLTEERIHNLLCNLNFSIQRIDKRLLSIERFLEENLD